MFCVRLLCVCVLINRRWIENCMCAPKQRITIRIFCSLGYFICKRYAHIAGCSSKCLYFVFAKCVVSVFLRCVLTNSDGFKTACCAPTQGITTKILRGPSYCIYEWHVHSARCSLKCLSFVFWQMCCVCLCDVFCPIADGLKTACCASTQSITAKILQVPSYCIYAWHVHRARCSLKCLSCVFWPRCCVWLSRIPPSARDEQSAGGCPGALLVPLPPLPLPYTHVDCAYLLPPLVPPPLPDRSHAPTLIAVWSLVPCPPSPSRFHTFGLIVFAHSFGPACRYALTLIVLVSRFAPYPSQTLTLIVFALSFGASMCECVCV